MSVAGLAGDLGVVGAESLLSSRSAEANGSVQTPLLGGLVEPAPAPSGSMHAGAQEVMASSLVLTPHGGLIVGADAIASRRGDGFQPSSHGYAAQLGGGSSDGRRDARDLYGADTARQSKQGVDRSQRSAGGIARLAGSSDP